MRCTPWLIKQKLHGRVVVHRELVVLFRGIASGEGDQTFGGAAVVGCDRNRVPTAI